MRLRVVRRNTEGRRAVRKYEMRQRAERVADTRRRILEATIELHRTVGPAAAEITEIARRAGVQRVTVYAHFPDEQSLLGACSAHWRGLHPAPDPSSWSQLDDPAERLRAGLRAMYTWYAETDPMTSNVLRDAELMETLRPIVAAGLGAWLERARVSLVEPFGYGDAAPEAVVAAVRVVTDVHGWRALAALGDDAADVAAGMVLSCGEPGRGQHSGPLDRTALDTGRTGA